jgi:hypothetical protein
VHSRRCMHHPQHRYVSRSFRYDSRNEEQVIPRIVESHTQLQEEVYRLGCEMASLEGLVYGLKGRFQRLASSLESHRLVAARAGRFVC